MTWRDQRRIFRLTQNDPERRLEPIGDPLQGGQAQVPPSSLKKAILCAVHPDVIRERLLAEPGTHPVAPDHIRDAHLQTGPEAFYDTALTLACYRHDVQISLDSRSRVSIVSDPHQPCDVEDEDLNLELERHPSRGHA